MGQMTLLELFNKDGVGAKYYVATERKQYKISGQTSKGFYTIGISKANEFNCQWMPNEKVVFPAPIKSKVAIKPLGEICGQEQMFSQTQIEHLQSEVYKITGRGEVMALFNKFLGVAAG